MPNYMVEEDSLAWVKYTRIYFRDSASALFSSKPITESLLKMTPEMSNVAVSINTVLVRLIVDDYGPLITLHGMNYALSILRTAAILKPQKEQMADEILNQLLKMTNGNPDRCVSI